MASLPNCIRGIIFDLDGTLYVSPEFAETIQSAAVRYISELRGLTPEDADRLMAATRISIVEESGCIPTLSAVCTTLGGTAQDLHACFSGYLRPEDYLVRNEQVVSLLRKLAWSLTLHLYTNNNRTLTERIINHLGMAGIFSGIRTIDDNWKAKPDEGTLELVLAEAGLKPSQALFVGDRYDIDLRLPEQRGCPVYLSQSIEQLLRLEEILAQQSRPISPY